MHPKAFNVVLVPIKYFDDFVARVCVMKFTSAEMLQNANYSISRDTGKIDSKQLK